MRQTGNKIFATEGGVLVRKEDGTVFGASLTLGYAYQIGGVMLDTPHKETISDYFEAKTIQFNGKNYYIAVDITLNELVDFLIRLRYSASQEFSIIRQRDRKQDEFAEYDKYCELCKSNAKSYLNCDDYEEK